MTAHGTNGDAQALRLPPQNLDAEREFLSALLLDPALVDEFDGLDPGDFYRESHEVILRAVRAVRDAGLPVDPVSVHEELERTGRLDAAGGPGGLAAVAASAPHAANARYHADVVRQKAAARRLIGHANETLRQCYSHGFTSGQLFDSAESRLSAAAPSAPGAGPRPLADFTAEAMERLARRVGGGEVSGLATGFDDLDDLLGGLAPGQLVVLAARPSMGKTALAAQVAARAAVEAGAVTLFVSLEMPGVEVAERFLVARSGVDGHKVRTGHGLSRRDGTGLGLAHDAAAGARGFYLDDAAGLTASQVASAARRLGARHGGALGLVVVDYLQLVEPPPERRRESRQEQVASVARRLKQLAKELAVPVLCLSQLNRQSESREDRRPRLADLRESGAIEQDADAVLLLHRPEFYDPNDSPGVAELNVAKNRSGPTGQVRLVFEKHLARFSPFSPALPPIDAPDF